MKNDFIRFGLIVAIIFIFAIFVYPTPIRYETINIGNGNTALAKINRITGKTMVFIPTDGGGWEEFEK